MILQALASGPALTNRVKHRLPLSVSLCLISACADRTEPAAASGRVVGEVFRDAPRISGGDDPEMAVLPGKSFRMGDLSGGAEEDEQPVRTVRMNRPIAIGRYEATVEEYGRFASLSGAARPNDKGWGGGGRPLMKVSWNGARAYAERLSGETGKTCRLPTEAEWEYAARAGIKTSYSRGNDIGHNRANCDGSGGAWDNKQTAPVGGFGAGPSGLRDMHGHVWEWLEDCSHNDRDAPANVRARTSGDCEYRVLRGGPWNDGPRPLRSANRGWSWPSYRFDVYGFQLVRELVSMAFSGASRQGASKPDNQRAAGKAEQLF